MLLIVLFGFRKILWLLGEGKGKDGKVIGLIFGCWEKLFFLMVVIFKINGAIGIYICFVCFVIFVCIECVVLKCVCCSFSYFDFIFGVIWCEWNWIMRKCLMIFFWYDFMDYVLVGMYVFECI